MLPEDIASVTSSVSSMSAFWFFPQQRKMKLNLLRKNLPIIHRVDFFSEFLFSFAEVVGVFYVLET